MATLSSVLAQIRQNESGGNYTLTPQQNYAYSTGTTHASGAYQFQPGTWQSLTQQSGIGTQYSEAYQAPPQIQDAVAAYALTQNPNANSSSLWGGGKTVYPLVDNYDVSPQAIAAGSSSLGGADYTGGFGGNALGGSTYVTGGAGTSSDPLNINMDVTPTQAPQTADSGGGQVGLGAGAEIGYTPPLWTGGPSTVGLAPGVAGQINTIAQNATKTFTSGLGGMFSGVENWVARGGIIIVAVIILLVALWRILDPSGDKTKAFAHAAVAA